MRLPAILYRMPTVTEPFDVSFRTRIPMPYDTNVAFETLTGSNVRADTALLNDAMVHISFG